MRLPLCEISIEPRSTGGELCVVVRYPFQRNQYRTCELTNREAAWILGSIPGYCRLDREFPEMEGRPISVHGGLYESLTPEEKFLIKEGRYSDLMRLRPFKPTLPRHFQALGLDVPSGENGEWVWVNNGKEG